MRTHGNWSFFAAFCFVALGVQALIAAEAGKTTAKAQPIRMWAWQTEEWTGDNKPYREIRSAIDKAIEQGENPLVLARKYKALRQKSPIDPEAQFRWAYATYKAVAASQQESAALAEVISRMDLTEKPRAYDYTRLRFLIGYYQYTWPKFDEMKTAGDRLLKRNPKDVDVKFRFIYILSCSPSLEDRKQAVTYAQELIDSNPKKASYYAILGTAYDGLFIKTKQQTYEDKAIAAYRKYLQLAPPNDHFRPSAERMVKLMERRRK